MKLKAKMAIREALYIRQCCDILDGLTMVVDDSQEDRQEKTEKTFGEKHLERFYLFALMWSLGAVLELDMRQKLQEFVLTHPSKLAWPKLTENESIFDYKVGDNGLWQHWRENVEPFIYPPDQVMEFSSILVPNVDNVRTNFLVDIISKQKKAVMLIGKLINYLIGNILTSNWNNIRRIKNKNSGLFIL